MDFVIVAMLMMEPAYKCVRWVWWWDSEYKYKIAQCVEWKKVDKK